MADALKGRLVRDFESLRNPACLEVIRQLHALRDADPLSDDFAPPPAPGWRSRQDHELYLKAVWERAFGFSPIGLDDDFFELGGQAHLAARLFARVFTRQELGLNTLLKASTIRRLASVIDAAAWELPEPLVQLGSGAGRALFLVHSLSETFLELSAVLRALDTSRPVYGLQSSRLPAGQAAHLRVENMAREYIGHIRHVQAQGPYALGGYSVGGLLAYEIAQQLCEAGESIELLALVDTHVHGRYLPFRQWWRHRSTRLLGTVRTLASMRTSRIAYLKKISLMLLDRARSVFGLTPQRPDVVGNVLREAHLAPERRRLRGALLTAMREYRPRPYPGRVVFFRAAETNYYDPLPFWRRVVRGNLEVKVTPGNHEEMILGDNARALAQAWAGYL